MAVITLEGIPAGFIIWIDKLEPAVFLLCFTGIMLGFKDGSIGSSIGV